MGQLAGNIIRGGGWGVGAGRLYSHGGAGLIRIFKGDAVNSLITGYKEYRQILVPYYGLFLLHRCKLYSTYVILTSRTF